ncbi:methyl-accepting chemotaxis protein [Rhodoblastus acidophilus]|uniref:methyl-accepting chemotaxis protein n=1 Tax=Rhodoblastus acidophilus TaxID=1074 RepID=UPI002225639A|nr:methyl-accepting chemotaxis protein [Rhodoblastus acidophilus]MCW2285047.1 methyl-accepting chemotaxis protein [Rhodoblastus acidophilus]MCW2334095.1 methyl-accepting chemotaxis protein [Rhodoblastus acidophilus]
MKKFAINLSLAAKIVMGVMLLGCGLNALASFYSLSALKVGGPVYQKVIQGKDLVADILPPPEYLIEAFLEVNLARDDVAGLDGHKQRLIQLRKDYDERHDYWVGQDLDPSVRDMLLRESDTPARRFWTLAFDSYIPALARGDRAEADAAFQQLKAAYGEHRAAVDKLVTATNRLTEEVEAQAARSDRLFTGIMAFFGLLAIGGTLAAYFGVARLIVRPIVSLGDAMTRMARGDLIDHAPFRTRKDEIGEMARSVEVFLANEHDRRRLAQSERATREREIQRQDDLQAKVKEFSSAIAGSVSELSRQTGALRSASTTLAAGAASVRGDADNAAAATTGAAANSQAVAAATAQLEASIREIAGQAERARLVVESAASAAEGATGNMEGLADSSRQIDAILDLIRNISGRTNLLALNATIEAARAGEAGRGFAVVANEVKGLSEQTGRAVDDIVVQIGEMHAVTGAAVDAIREINGKVAEIRDMTLGIAGSVSQQDEATREIAQNVTLAAARSQQAAQNVHAVTVTAERTDAEAGQLANASAAVAGAADRITAAMESFVAMVQADLTERRAAMRQAA